MTIKVGIAGVGAIGGAVTKKLLSSEGIDGFALRCICDPNSGEQYNVDNVSLEKLVDASDLIIECLPAAEVPTLASMVFKANKDIIFISSAALLVYPQILDELQNSGSRAHLPSGALCGLDGVIAMKEMGIEHAQIASTKPPLGFNGAPFVMETGLDLTEITEKTMIFSGNALEASKGFPANINVAATLSLAGIGAEKTCVEIWADPVATGNAHEITVKSAYSTLTSRIENMPDPANPKSSVLAAQSIIATLRNMSNALVI